LRERKVKGKILQGLAALNKMFDILERRIEELTFRAILTGLRGGPVQAS